jgi:uncharacterized protein YcgI (DUF1989 family)
VIDQPIENRLEPQTGTAFRLLRGETLRVVDLQGEQVSDLIAFSPDGEEWLSSGRTIDYNSTLRLTLDHILYSNRSSRMLTITSDEVGVHDFLYAPCSPEMFEALYGFDRSHPSCFRNLAGSLAGFGIQEDRIPTTFNVFMNVEMLSTGELKVLPPVSKAGEAIEFRAEMDLVIGLTACSAEQSNNWSFKPIGWQVLPPNHPLDRHRQRLLTQ